MTLSIAPDGAVLSEVAGHLAEWGEEVVAVLAIVVPDDGPAETLSMPFFAMDDDRKVAPGCPAGSLNAAADTADLAARRALGGRPGITAWARVERGGAYSVVWERRARSTGVRRGPDTEEVAAVLLAGGFLPHAGPRLRRDDPEPSDGFQITRDSRYAPVPDSGGESFTVTWIPMRGCDFRSPALVRKSREMVEAYSYAFTGWSVELDGFDWHCMRLFTIPSLDL